MKEDPTLEKEDGRMLEALTKMSTPTVANAIELFDVRPRDEGFMNSSVKCIFPGLGVMVGRAVTVRISTATRPNPDAVETTFRYWKSILNVPAPRVVVMEDVDDPPGMGAFWGEVNSNIHRALGCVGTVTNGSIRDLDEVEALGFRCFAGGVAVSHAYNHIVDFGTKVKVGGLTISPGDILHADKHGVLQVPDQVAARIPAAAQALAEREREVIDHSRSDDFSLEELRAKVKRMKEAGKDFH
jgi:4-hydroxy-4-methyl-2-oxoglutarate aldolase